MDLRRKSLNKKTLSMNHSHLAVCLTVAAVLFLPGIVASCSSPSDSSPPLNSSSYTSSSYSYDVAETEHVHSPIPLPDVPPTCETDGHTGGMQCATCKFYIELPVTVEKLGHTCETGVCERCGRFIRFGVPAPETGVWHNGVFLDVFGDPTDEECIFSDTIKGNFSNSATNNSSLSVGIYATDEEFRFILYEYDKYTVRDSFHTIEANIKHGNTKEVVYPHFRDEFLIFRGGSYDKIRIALCAGNDVQFVITEQDGTSTYRFTVEASNFVTSYLNYMLE